MSDERERNVHLEVDFTTYGKKPQVGQTVDRIVRELELIGLDVRLISWQDEDVERS